MFPSRTYIARFGSGNEHTRATRPGYTAAWRFDWIGQDHPQLVRTAYGFARDEEDAAYILEKRQAWMIQAGARVLLGETTTDLTAAQA